MGPLLISTGLAISEKSLVYTQVVIQLMFIVDICIVF